MRASADVPGAAGKIFWLGTAGGGVWPTPVWVFGFSTPKNELTNLSKSTLLLLALNASFLSSGESLSPSIVPSVAIFSNNYLNPFD